MRINTIMNKILPNSNTLEEGTLAHDTIVHAETINGKVIPNLTEEEKKKLQEEMEKRRSEFEAKGKDILAKFKDDVRKSRKAMEEAGIPMPIINELAPEEKKEEGAPAK